VTVAPDLFIFGLPGNFRGYYRGYSCHTQVDKDTGQENHRRFTWAILKGRTRNRGEKAGTVRLASTDPTRRPEINFNFFDSGVEEWPKDRDALIEAVRFVELLLANPQLGAEIVWPKPEDRRTDEALGAFILREAWGHHACGTCKIGPKEDKDAVLDTRFRVRGVNNLRVVDASVFPKIPGFFIITSIYMISEKASQDILEDQEKPRDDWPKAP
jgi:choline dehydrogenase